MTLFRFRKEKHYRRAFFSALCLAAVLLLFCYMADRIRISNEAEQTAILENAVTRTIPECYALEGSYPPDIAYLTTHYGLTYDTDLYLIDYRYIGANLRPDVTIIKRN